MVAGRSLGEKLLADNPIADHYMPAQEGAGSCIGILATNAPLLPAQLQALARRMPLGLARTGTTGSHFSGDIFLAFSTANMKSNGAYHSLKVKVNQNGLTLQARRGYFALEPEKNKK